MSKPKQDEEYSTGVMDESIADEFEDLFGGDLENIAKDNSKLAEDLLSGKVKSEDVAVNVVNKDPRTYH